MTDRDLSCEGGFKGAQISVPFWPVTCSLVHYRINHSILWYQLCSLIIYAFRLELVSIAVIVVPGSAK